MKGKTPTTLSRSVGNSRILLSMKENATDDANKPDSKGCGAILWTFPLEIKLSSFKK